MGEDNDKKIRSSQVTGGIARVAGRTGIAALKELPFVDAAFAGLDQLRIELGVKRDLAAELRDEMQRLFDGISERIAHAEARSWNAEEVMELALQTTLNYRRTTRQEKRRLMTNVLLNGLSESKWRGARVELFSRAVAELSLAHIDLFQDLTGRLLQSGVRMGLAQGLVGFGFAQADKSEFRRKRIRHPDGRKYRTTELGGEFLAFLRDPDPLGQ